MTPTTQKALILPEAKADWKLINEWPIVQPGPNEVLVRLVAVAVNPVDEKNHAGNMPSIKYPFVGGIEGSGVVEEVGREVASVAKGDRILLPGGFDPRRAAFKQYTVCPVEKVAKIPKNVTFEQAAAIPVAVATVVSGIWSNHPQATSIRLTPAWAEGGLTKYIGQPAFISGGSSSVGQIAIQLAKLQGFAPIITTASLRHAGNLKSLGATAVIDRMRPAAEIIAQVTKVADGKPVLYAYDAIGDEDTQNIAYDVLAPEGALATTIPGSEATLAEKEKRDGGSKRVARVLSTIGLPMNREVGLEMFKRLPQWLEDGTIKPNRVEVVPGGFEGIVEACKRHASGQVSGVKLVVKLSEA